MAIGELEQAAAELAAAAETLGELAPLAGMGVAEGDQEALEALCKTLEERPQLAPALAQWMIPALTPAPASAIAGRRYVGQMVKFHADRYFGFIACPEVKEAYGCDVWVHGAQVGSFREHDTVSFALLLNKDSKPQAFDLVSPDDQKGKGKGKVACVGKGKGGFVGDAGFAADFRPQSFKGGGAAWGGNHAGAGPTFGVKRKLEVLPASQEVRYVGSIANFRPEKGFGFITCPEINEVYGKDVWLHHAQFAGFNVGDLVSFTMRLNPQGNPQAIDLAIDGIAGGGIAPRASFAAPQKAQKGGGKPMTEHGKGKEKGKGGFGQRYEGVVSALLPEKGFAFIGCEELQALYGKEVWVHNKQIKQFQVDDAVTFTMVLGTSGQPQAIDLEAI